MSIIGLTDGQPSFKEIGRLRKGAPKTAGTLSDLTYFRADFRPDEMSAAQEFATVYGNTPTRINIRLAFPLIQNCWDAWWEVYNSSGMLGQADGERWLYLRHNKTGELLVKNGVPHMAFDPTVPVYSYRSEKKNQDIPVFAKPTGKLRVMIPELRRAAYVLVLTHSWYDVGQISSQLAGIKELAERIGMTLPMVPLVLTRRPQTISVAYNGKKSLAEKWLINIEIEPEWAAAQFKYLEQIQPGMLLPAPAPIPALPAGVPDETVDDEDPDPYDYDASPVDPQTSEPEPAQPENNGTRPYAPVVVIEKLNQRAATYGSKKATQKQRGLAAMLIEQAFAGDDKKRHDVQNYMFGSDSLNEVADGVVLAMLNDWLKPVQDSGGAYVIDAMAERELVHAFEAAMKAQGQTELPLDF